LSLVRVLSIAGKITTSRPGEATPKQRNLAKKQARKTPRLQEEERDEADRPRQATHGLVRANAFAAAQLLRIGDLARQERNADLQWKERKGLRSRCLHGPRAEEAERLSACLPVCLPARACGTSCSSASSTPGSSWPSGSSSVWRSGREAVHSECTDFRTSGTSTPWMPHRARVLP